MTWFMLAVGFFLLLSGILSQAYSLKTKRGATSKKLLHAGVYCREIRQPMVPAGKARLRAQISAAHTKEELDFALEAFGNVGKNLKLISR